METQTSTPLRLKTPLPFPLLMALLVFFLSTPVASANESAIFISRVLYDPAPEYGDEAIVIVHNGSVPMHVGGWALSTTTSEKDATIPNGTVLLPGQSYLIAGTKWNASAPLASEADHIEAITLRNTDGGIALRDANGNIVDAVGWGEAANIPSHLYQGAPAQPTPKGDMLKRVAFTGDNAQDYRPVPPDFILDGNGLHLEAEVNSTAANASAVNLSVLEDDHPDRPGIQLYPLPGQNRLITVVVGQPGELRFGNQTVPFEPQGNGNGSYIAQLFLSHTLPPGPYTLDFYEASAASASTPSAIPTASLAFEWLSVRAWAFDPNKVRFDATPGQSALVSTAVQNLGNTPLTLRIQSHGLHNGEHFISAKRLLMKFGISAFKETDQSRTITVDIGETIDLWLRLDVPASAAQGSYRGVIRATAVEE